MSYTHTHKLSGSVGSNEIYQQNAQLGSGQYILNTTPATTRYITITMQHILLLLIIILLPLIIQLINNNQQYNQYEGEEEEWKHDFKR